MIRGFALLIFMACWILQVSFHMNAGIDNDNSILYFSFGSVFSIATYISFYYIIK